MILSRALILLLSGIEAKPTINLIMKFTASLFTGLFIFSFACTGLSAQSSKKTILLVRHAEKDVSETADKSDPELTVAGRDRAERLVKKMGKYKPGAIYSTNFKRTRTTVEPLAKKRKLTVQFYDARKQNEIVEQILKSKTKRFVVAGHSNTIPLLANLLIKKELFKPLDDSEYATIWLIKVKDGKVTKVEILDY